MGTISTTFLTSDSDFVTGMGSAVNLGGNFYDFNYAESSQLADIRAMRADWAMIGKDVAVVLEKAEADLPSLTEN